MFRRSIATNSIYFGKNSLNRVSFLRNDAAFIKDSITSDYSNYIFFNNLNPIIDPKTNKLFTLNYNSLSVSTKPIIDSWIGFNSKKEISILDTPLIVFLGLNQQLAQPSQFKYKSYNGSPYYAMEISSSPEFQKLLAPFNLKELPTREDVNNHLDNTSASIFSQARMYLEWLSSTRYCKGCGAKTIPISAGNELYCSSAPESNCPVRSAPVSNASFPRLDPVLITCVVNHDNTKVLLTSNAKYPKPMYTCIAGFIEPSETIENAVIREVWEEAGLEVSDVEIVRSQPWPYPSNMMIGCVARVSEKSKIDLENDNELVEAKWVDIGDVKKLVREGSENKDSIVVRDGLEFGLPNDKTIANQLYQYVAGKYA